MSGGEVAPLFIPEEMAAMAAEVAADQRELDEWVKWLQTPAAKAEADALVQEAAATWAAFAQGCRDGKYVLTPAEIEQLRRDGILCHAVKRGSSGYD